jgi:hypothetical protein
VTQLEAAIETAEAAAAAEAVPQADLQTAVS